MPRLLLILPSATYRATDFVEAARRLGVEVVVASDRRQALAPMMGSRSLTIPLHDAEAAASAIVAHADSAPLDAVVAVDDQGTVPAALAAERLGLAHNPPAAVAATRDKRALRERLAAAGVAQPPFGDLGPGEAIEPLLARTGLPCVVKPVSLSGSRGVIRADTVDEAVAAAERVRRILAEAGEDPAARILVEGYLDGDEVAVEALLRDGAPQILAVFDKPDPLVGPFFAETLYVTPPRRPAAEIAAIEAAVADAAAALGLREGPVHAEVRLTARGPVLLELAARSIGGLCARALRFELGASLEELIARHALGLPLDALLRREHAASGVLMLPIPAAGVLREVAGQEAARAVPGVTGVEITVPVGSAVAPLPEGDRYLGFVFARGLAPEEVEATLRAAWKRLEVAIDPEGATSSPTRSTGSCRSRDR